MVRAWRPLLPQRRLQGARTWAAGSIPSSPQCSSLSLSLLLPLPSPLPPTLSENQWKENIPGSSSAPKLSFNLLLCRFGGAQRFPGTPGGWVTPSLLRWGGRVGRWTHLRERGAGRRGPGASAVWSPAPPAGRTGALPFSQPPVRGPAQESRSGKLNSSRRVQTTVFWLFLFPERDPEMRDDSKAQHPGTPDCKPPPHRRLSQRPLRGFKASVGHGALGTGTWPIPVRSVRIKAGPLRPGCAPL